MYKILISNYMEPPKIVEKKTEIETDGDFENEFVLKPEIHEDESETKENLQRKRRLK